MKNNLLQPQKIIIDSFRYWWILTLFILIGGGIGYLTVINLKPVYQTKAVYSISIDYTKTGKLSDTEEDEIIGTAGEIFLSDKVVSEVIEALKNEKINLSEKQFRNLTKTERTNDQLILSVRSEVLDEAEIIIKEWTDVSTKEIRNGQEHANLSNIYHHQLTALINCVQQVPAVEQASPICGFDDRGILQEKISKISKQEKAEEDQSQGLNSAVKMGLVFLDTEANKNLQIDKNLGIITGAMIGFFVYILMYSFIQKTDLPK
jgi:hypothetical protein